MGVRRCSGPIVVSVLLVLIASACTPAPGASPVGTGAPAAAPAPVVLVPGWEFGCIARSDDWDAWRDAFVARGLPEDRFVVVRYDSCQPNRRTAQMVGDAVTELRARTGSPRVHLIAHSMGAIPARWCLRVGECRGAVDQLVTLSGAHRGTIWAGACFLQFWGRACADMQPDSPVLAWLNEDVAPSGVGIETWTSACELVIVPRESAFLAGAVNRDLVSDCVDHSGWKRHAPTIATVSDRLAGAMVSDRLAGAMVSDRLAASGDPAVP